MAHRLRCYAQARFPARTHPLYPLPKKGEYHSLSKRCSVTLVTIRFLHALFLLAIVGQNQPAAAASTGTAAPSKSQTQLPLKTPADAQIERAMKNKLAKSKLNADHFSVSVVKGVATIEGNTSVLQHKGAMTRIAKACGATSVRNNIRVSDAAKAKATAGFAKKTTSDPAPRATVDSPPPVPAPVPHATVLPPALR